MVRLGAYRGGDDCYALRSGATRWGQGDEMGLEKLLNDSLTKESGGRQGGKGHEFQRYWALCHLLQLDLENDDYLMLLEFIEDVAVLDTEVNASSIDLFQLKKKEGKSPKWTQASLTSIPKDGKSIFAKLLESKSSLAGNCARVTFVSNAPIDLALESDDDSKLRARFLASELSGSVLSAIKRSLAVELACCADDIQIDDLEFLRSGLAMDELETHSFGRVSKYLADKFPDHNARADVFCRALYSEIKVKATSTEEAGDFATLKKIRGISKVQFSRMLSETISRKPDVDLLDEAISELVVEGVPFVVRDSIKKLSRRFLVDKAGKSENFDALYSLIDGCITEIPNDLVKLWDVANWILKGVRGSDSSSNYAAIEDNYLLAVVLYRVKQ